MTKLVFLTLALALNLTLSIPSPAQSPMERVLEQKEQSLVASGLSYEFTRYPGKNGTAYVAYQFGTPHGTACSMVYVAQDGTTLDITGLLPNWFTYGAAYYANPRDIQFDETGEKLSFITYVKEGSGGYGEPEVTKEWGDTLCTVDLTTGTMESMVPLTPQEQ